MSLKQTLQQAEELKTLSRTHIDDILEVHSMRQNTVEKVALLHDQAIQLKDTSEKIKSKFWWKNKKMTLILGAVALCFIVVILIYIFK